MPFNIVNNDVVEVTAVGGALGQVVINRWDYRCGVVAVGSTVDSTQFLTAFSARWVNTIGNFLNQQFAIVRYELRQIIGGFVPGGVPVLPAIRVYNLNYDERAGVPAVDVGSVAGDGLPTFVAVSVQKRTGFRGRTRRGSSHFSPITEADTIASGNALTGARLTAIQALLTTFNGGITAGLAVPTNFTHSLFSATESGLAAPQLAAWNYAFPVTSYVAKLYTGSQVSRKALSATA